MRVLGEKDFIQDVLTLTLNSTRPSSPFYFSILFLSILISFVNHFRCQCEVLPSVTNFIKFYLVFESKHNIILLVPP